MLDALKALLSRRAPADAEPRHQLSHLQVAACALLLELAHADDEFTAEERQTIEEMAMRHFDLDAEAARDLLALAEEARSHAVDLYQFTSLVAEQYDEGQRMLLAELMWRVIHADGRLAEQEAQLARKLANLLDISPGYLAEAKRKAERGTS
jgi:uncharacterized tellurite resistance protein B-like protein